VRRILVATALAVAVGACALFDPEPSGKFTVLMPARELVDPVVIDVVDRTETVEAIAIERGHFPDGIFSEANDPAVLIVTWMGGMCDVRTTLTVEPTIDTIQITEVTERAPRACRLAGITRSIAIRFDPPLRPEFVEFVPALPGAAEP
jgi:hypothetical protein